MNERGLVWERPTTALEGQRPRLPAIPE
jgi:hypothetical protein